MGEAGVAFSSVPPPEFPPGAAPGRVRVDCSPAVRAAATDTRDHDNAFTGPLRGDFLHLSAGDVRVAPRRVILPASRCTAARRGQTKIERGRSSRSAATNSRLQKPPSARTRATLDLVISAIVRASDFSGLDLVRRLRATHPELPIRFINGYRPDHADAQILNLPGRVPRMIRKSFASGALVAGRHDALAPAPRAD